MSYGDTAAGFNAWSLEEDAAQPLFPQAIELGVTFWDTANDYQRGSSEESVGRAMRRYARREEIVLATKVSGKMHDGPGGQGLSRKAILEQLDASLARLGTEYVASTTSTDSIRTLPSRRRCRPSTTWSGPARSASSGPRRRRRPRRRARC